MALARPDLLLISGPLLFGYPHLIASFRFIRPNMAYLFFTLTLVCILGRLFLTTQIPFGVWQIIIAFLGLCIIKWRNMNTPIATLLFTLIFCLGLIGLAYLEPIMFIGGSLIVHNWIGFFYWMRASSNLKRKKIAISCFFLFLMIHVSVLNGQFDSYFSFMPSNETLTTAWYLASWSSDPIVWYRVLVLYAFGLSMHYFVWLKAIPESKNSAEHPSSFRLTIKNMQKEFGRNLFFLFSLISITGVLIWIFYFPFGSQFYFECAILHGMLEIVFLVEEIFARNKYSLT
jgi:hypothetical protein